MYEAIDAKNKGEAKQKYIARMKEVMPRYGLTFGEEDISAIDVRRIYEKTAETVTALSTKKEAAPTR